MLPADAASEELDAAIEQFRRAQEAFVKGDPEPVKPLHSRHDDITLANPLGPIRRGWAEVEDAIDRAAATVGGGGGVRYEEVSRYVTPEIAYVVRVERTETKVGGQDDLSPVSLRVTMIYRREGGSWKIVHRHADPITAARPPESIIER